MPTFNTVKSSDGEGPKRLILCFDGTGNTFSGSNADTNVVKILNKLDRNNPNQYHYYQTGIGTYDINEKSVNKTTLGEIRSSISQTIDQAIGTTFDAHVMAGYRFLMRYYDSGDKIYMFGFSRGAFTAKFLARMVHTVGLLCKGNEEMVPFAYRLYQKYLAGETEDFVKAQPVQAAKIAEESDCSPQANGSANGNSNGHTNGKFVGDEDEEVHGATFEMARDEITAFSHTFCRKEQVSHNGHWEERNIKVYFLGIWDCVNSVAVLERNAPIPQPVKGTAHYIRHAVAVDERRVKFKAALINQDTKCTTQTDEDIKEVWFPGCHGDVGGGWPAEEGNALEAKKTGWFSRLRNLFTRDKAKGATKDVRRDPFQLSDVPLAWMIRELELIGEKDPDGAVKWCDSVNGFKRRIRQEEVKTQARSGFIHDSLRFGLGTGFFTVLLWKFMEFLPIIKRWELSDKTGTWKNVRFPLNKGATRDIPRDAVLHESLLWRLKNDKDYCPRNNHGGWLPPCLKHKGTIVKVTPEKQDADSHDPDHQTYTIVRTD